MKTFSRYTRNDTSGVVVTWGRFNPPTVGHEAMFNEAARVANSRGYVLRIHATRSSDSEGNPLLYEKKIAHMRDLFPRYRDYIREDNSNNIVELLTQLSKSFSNVVIMCGEDRVDDYNTLVERLNIKIEVVSAGRRDPDAEGVEGMSSSYMRRCVKEGDFTNFMTGLPSNTDHDKGRTLFEDVRRGMGIRERYVPVALERSEEREKFYSGELVNENDLVEIVKTGEQGRVRVIGANYVIIESNGAQQRHWAKDIKRVE